MRLLLDPQLFEPVASSSAPTASEVEELEVRLGEIAKIVSRSGASIHAPEELRQELIGRYIGPAYSKSSSPRVKQALTFLRNQLVWRVPTVPKVRAWGYLPLMAPLKADALRWANSLASAAASAALAKLPVFLYTPLIVGRNAVLHQVGDSKLLEKTRWRTYVGTVGLRGATPVPCVSTARNVVVQWTGRFDEELPDTAPMGGFRFQPPVDWEKRGTPAVRVVASKVGWLDAFGNRWVAPNTQGNPYHWDVHFKSASSSPIGISPVNVSRWSAPGTEGPGGRVHHVPKKKRSRAK